MKDYSSEVGKEKDIDTYKGENQYASNGDRVTVEDLTEHYDEKRRFSFKEIERKYKKVAHVGRDRKG